MPGDVLRDRKDTRNGMFLSFDGLDGTGKSTQARRLYEALLARGEDVVLTREPGGTLGAEHIRSLILDREKTWSPETEILLFNAARRDHIEKLILPGLKRGAIVICDRFVDSTLAYQGAKSEDLFQVARDIHETVIGLWPDKTLIIELPEEERLSRLSLRGGPDDALETRVREQGARMRAIYDRMEVENSDRILRIDGRGSEDEIEARIMGHLPEFAPAATSLSCDFQT